MAKPLSTNGLQELYTFRRRVRRQFALDRISEADSIALDTKATELIDMIHELEEKDGEDTQ